MDDLVDRIRREGGYFFFLYGGLPKMDFESDELWEIFLLKETARFENGPIISESKIKQLTQSAIKLGQIERDFFDNKINQLKNDFQNEILNFLKKFSQESERTRHKGNLIYRFHGDIDDLLLRLQKLNTIHCLLIEAGRSKFPLINTSIKKLAHDHF